MTVNSLLRRALFGLLFLASAGAAETNFSARAELAFSNAQKQYLTNPADPAILTAYARTAFDWAEFAKRDQDRAHIAQEGIKAARRMIEIAPNSAAGHYYLGLNLGQLAQTKTLGALAILNEMVSAWEASAKIDPHYDYAGANRSLGLLYFAAPGWPVSVGSKAKAAVHLEKAVALEPGYPDNQLCLMEAWLRWNQRGKLRENLEKVAGILAAARKTLTGETWEESWILWDSRWQELQKAAKGK